MKTRVGLKVSLLVGVWSSGGGGGGKDKGAWWVAATSAANRANNGLR